MQLSSNYEQARPGWWRWPERAWFARQLQSSLGIALTFVAAYEVLSVSANTHWPGSEDDLSYLLPSLDITLVLLAFALAALVGFKVKRIPVAVYWVLSVLCLVVRLLRIGDGMEGRFYSRNFSLYMDLPLLPELVRLGYATISHFFFACTVVLIVVAIVGSLILNYFCWRHLAQVLAHKRPAWIFLGVTTLFALASIPAKPRHAFSASIVPRLVQEGDFLIHGARYRSEVVNEVNHVDDTLLQGPSDLAQLNQVNVFVFIIESYGETLLELKQQHRLIRQTFNRFERMAASQGYQIASRLLDSPTYGGSSWLAHATLNTAVTTNNQFRYRVVSGAHPLTLSWFFEQAGYRTVLAQPATTRSSPENTTHHYYQEYYAWDFDYKGPGFSWATMPDQYVLEFLYRKEVAAARSPLFVECALVSSHAPWNNQPPIISDSNLIGDGRIYNRLKAVEFSTSWSDMSQATVAYARSIDYDFRVLSRFLSERIHDSSLVIILGDHQPNGDVTHHSELHGVPIHVMSRNRDFIERFIAQGYTTGMEPSLAQPRLPMDQFTPSLLRNFSTKAVSPVTPRLR